jgi:hypothetical protein
MWSVEYGARHLFCAFPVTSYRFEKSTADSFAA